MCSYYTYSMRKTYLKIEVEIPEECENYVYDITSYFSTIKEHVSIKMTKHIIETREEEVVF